MLDINISRFVKSVLVPNKLRIPRRHFGGEPVVVLDIGCGNYSCETTKKWLNVKKYIGVDKEYWEGDKESYEDIDQLIFVDLEKKMI